MSTTSTDGSQLRNHVVYSHDFLRLYWTLQGPLTSAISVMKNKYYEPEVLLEPYYVQTDTGPIWSTVVQSPLTEPAISSLDVGVEVLQEWDEQWTEVHTDHATFEPASDDEENGAKFGPLPEFDPEEDEEGPEHLVRCCGQDRPRGADIMLTLTASGPFITVHDYVSAVHPWLMSLREKILQASGDLEKNIALPVDTALMVTSYTAPGSVVTVDEDRWKRMKSMAKHI
jgi:hypothetical protein